MNNNNKNTSITIWSQKMAGYLMLRGFVLVSMLPDKDDDRRNVFFFKESDQLKKAMQEYKLKIIPKHIF